MSEKMYCQSCGKKFSSKYHLLRHLRESCSFRNQSPLKKIKVDLSEENLPNTSRNDSSSTIECPVCNENISKNCFVGHMRQNSHRTVISTIEDGVEQLYRPMKFRIASYRFSSRHHHIDHTAFFSEIYPKVFAVISKYINMWLALKVNFELFSTYVKADKDIFDLKSFNTENVIITVSTDLEKLYREFTKAIETKASEFQERDSGWSLQQIMFLEVNINKYNPLRASSYIKLPKQIEVKRAVINIVNHDNKCFAWAVNAALFPTSTNTSRISSYPHYSTALNFEGIEFPVKLSSIPLFERLNNISINVFGISSEFKDGKTVYELVGPYYFTESRRNVHVNLLLITDDEGNSHYCFIKNLSRLVSSQRSKHNGQTHICDGCLQFFPTPERLKLHLEHDCNFICTKLPTHDLKKNKLGEMVPGNLLKFTNFEKQLSVPFVIYADFECILKPIHNTQPSDESSFTLKTYEHIPYSFCFYVKCNFDDSLSKLVHYRGSNVSEIFIQKLEKVVISIYNKHLKIVKPMQALSEFEQQSFNSSMFCHICTHPFDDEVTKVRDHCHLTGRYRGAAHANCNLNFQIPRFIPVFFHNLGNYDAHVFIKKLALNQEKIDVIAQNKEKYISFSKHILVEEGLEKNVYIKLRFVDSFRFLSASLDKLSQTLEPDQCVEIKKYFSDNVKFGLIRRKGVFPYSYLDSASKLNDNKLPSKEIFFDILSGTNISDEEYNRANIIWNTFQCQNLGEYSDIYLLSDVLLLADVFENFRKTSLDKYHLDPAQYMTAPSLSWDAMLRMTGVTLELLTDVDMLHFFRRGIRGGICQCTTRKAIANNKFISDYDPSKPNSFIIYLDATNLYGWAMSQSLPTGEFRWLDAEEILNFNPLFIDDDNAKGYVLEVDIEYPEYLHDKHNDLPFCSENFVPPNSKHSKLTLTLHDKKHYVIHFRNLKQCLKHGLKITKIHKVLEFAQSPWLKPYIDLNTDFRNSSNNEFHKGFFKTFINSIFGKTMENVDKRVNIKLLSHWENVKGRKGVESFVSMPNFKSTSVFSENLVAVQMSPLSICYDKPLYVGFSILEISKTIIYDFFYNFIKAKYGENASLCYTDTDSLVLEIKTNNVYDDIKQNIEWFDTSNYKEKNFHGISKNKSLVGKMKDEYAGTPIKSFYGTGAKAYCVELTDGETKKAKGISKNVIKNNLSVLDYKNIVESGGSIYRKMYVFRSHLHTMYTELKNKVALTSHDDKRYVIPGAVKTLAWGHKEISSKSNPERLLEKLLKIADELVDPEPDDSYNFYLENFDLGNLT